MRTPSPPWVVLMMAFVLPGAGQVMNDQGKRGLIMVFYMLLLGLLTAMVAPADASWVGNFAGGVFVYAMSIMDAYRTAVVRRQIMSSAAVSSRA
jgi:TM2 domain-containing membrane protein YozV